MNGERELIEEVTSWCVLKVAEKTPRSLFLPAGKTLVPVYRAWTKAPPPFLNGLKLRQLDEVLEGEKRGCFAEFFTKELPGFRVEGAEGPEEPADLAILGLGTNGHVAFHEPGVPETFSHGELKLSAESANGLGVSRGTKAITYGVGALLKAKSLLLVATGDSKQQVLKRFFAKEAALPAVFLEKHGDLTVIADKAAYG